LLTLKHPKQTKKDKKNIAKEAKAAEKAEKLAAKEKPAEVATSTEEVKKD